MPLNTTTKKFTRAFAFVDEFAIGDEVTREALDQALDDLAGGINGIVALGYQEVGEWSAASGAFPMTRPDLSAIQAKDAWRVTAAGTVGGQAFVAGDFLVALRAGGGVTYTSNWLRVTGSVATFQSLANRAELAAAQSESAKNIALGAATTATEAAEDAEASAAILGALAERADIGPFVSDGAIVDFNLPFDPVNHKYVELFIGNGRAWLNDDFTVIVKDDSPSGYGIRLSAVWPPGVVIRGSLVRPAQPGQGVEADLPILTPQQFGAIGNGVADDTLAIGAFFVAMQGAQTLGQMRGTYRITADFEITHRITLDATGSNVVQTVYPNGFIRLRPGAEGSIISNVKGSVDLAVARPATDPLLFRGYNRAQRFCVVRDESLGGNTVENISGTGFFTTLCARGPVAPNPLGAGYTGEDTDPATAYVWTGFAENNVYRSIYADTQDLAVSGHQQKRMRLTDFRAVNIVDTVDEPPHAAYMRSHGGTCVECHVESGSGANSPDGVLHKFHNFNDSYFGDLSAANASGVTNFIDCLNCTWSDMAGHNTTSDNTLARYAHNFAGCTGVINGASMIAAENNTVGLLEVIDGAAPSDLALFGAYFDTDWTSAIAAITEAGIRVAGASKLRVYGLDARNRGDATGHLLRTAGTATLTVSGMAARGVWTGFSASSGTIYLSIDPRQIENWPLSIIGNVYTSVLEMTPEMFGAVGNGITDDTAAFQAFFSWFGAARVAGPTGARIPPRRYLLSDRITCTANTGFRSWLDWDGAEFICDFDRAPDKYEFFLFGNPANWSDYQAAIDIRGRAFFTRGANCTYPPVAVRAPAWAQSTLAGTNAGSWGNTIVDLIGAQNVECSDWTIYSGGYSFPYLSTTGTLYRQTGTNLVRVSGAVDFPTSCVGKTIEITAGSDSRKTRITAWLSATSVTVENTATDTVDQAVYFGSPAVTTTSGSATVTLDGAVTSDMVGLLVGIPFAGANQRILWATVTAVNTGAGTLTLDKTAGQTLNPMANPLTQTTEIATPAVALRSEKISDGGLFVNGISQVRFNNLQIETYRGVAIGIDDAEFLHFTQAKCHGISGPTGSIYACAHIWGNQVGGSWIGEFDQRTMGRWKMVFARQTQAFTFLSLTARTRNNELLLGIGPNASGFPGAEINFNNLTLTGIDVATFALLVDDRTSTGGYFPPSRFFVPDGDYSVAALNRQVSADNTGALTINSLVMPAPSTFTPVVADASSGGNVATVGSSNGVWQRIGNIVFFSIRIIDINTAALTPSNNLVVRGLPVPLRAATFNTFNSAMRINNMTFTLPPTAFADDGDSHIIFYQPVSGASATAMTCASLASGTADLYISGSYFV